jgi:hypothetical protein
VRPEPYITTPYSDSVGDRPFPQGVRAMFHKVMKALVAALPVIFAALAQPRKPLTDSLREINQTGDVLAHPKKSQAQV